jgi:hypothetical protein
MRFLPWALAALFFVACGARSTLGVDDGGEVEIPDAARDVAVRDSSMDSADVVLPGIDSSRRDANRTNCPDADMILIYVLASNADLYSFLPPSTFTRIGKLACPAGSAQPFSMAVSRSGIAYSVFTDGNLFRIDTHTGACTATSYTPNQQDFTTFGMGFVADPNTGVDTLYVAQGVGPSSTRKLATIDTTTFDLNVVGTFSAFLPRSEVTGTADGRLFAYWIDSPGPGSHIAEVDPSTAVVLGATPLSVGSRNVAFAFAFWGGDFYIFTSSGGGSDVTRFRLSDGSETLIGTAPATIVGAGVSTCAPN